jgi:hypothetical protein
MDVDDVGKLRKAWGIFEALHSNALLLFVFTCYHCLHQPSEYLIFLEITIHNSRSIQETGCSGVLLSMVRYW